MNNILKITAQRQVKALSFFLFYLFLLMIAYLITINLEEAFFVIFGPISFFLVLPTLFLHVEYLFRNKKEEYELCGNRIIRRKENKEDVYYNEDVKKVEMFVSPNYFNNDVYFTAYANYHFAKVYLKSGEILYITSLLEPKGIDKAFNEYLKDIPYRKVKRLFATTFY